MMPTALPCAWMRAKGQAPKQQETEGLGGAVALVLQETNAKMDGACSDLLRRRLCGMREGRRKARPEVALSDRERERRCPMDCTVGLESYTRATRKFLG